MSHGDVTVYTLEQDRNLLAIDVRPFDERYDSIGFIPGSLRIPDFEAERWVQDLSRSHAVVLVCMSGKRSAEMRDQWTSQGTDLRSLDGGALAWGEAGYGLAGNEEAMNAPPNMDIARNLQSCFVAHTAEMLAALGMDNVDPVGLLRQCFEAEGVSFEDHAPHELFRVLDRAALYSRQLGSSHLAMARNMDMFLPALKASAAEGL